MSSALKKIAVVGASGRLGPFILKALQDSKAGFDVTAITRKNSTATFDANTKVVKVTDGYPDEEMVETFRGYDAVVLVISFASEHHGALVRASIKAGVKRLIPSGFGAPSNEHVNSFFPVAKTKTEMIADLKTLEQPGWSWTDVSCGAFLDFCMQVNFFGIDPKNKTAEIWDDGNARFTATTRESIGLAVAGVLSKPEETKNRTVYVSSTELSLNDLLAAEQKVVGKDGWAFTNINTDEEIPKQQQIVATATDRMAQFMATGRLGLASVMKPEYGANLKARGLLENDLLGVPQESLDDIVEQVLAK
ncbi:Isoflavone reductase like P3 [Fusarium albosuccineum]|uniref:Isoflavone reductase like P3 n=1 Tax=Fusarium albosuccineum TaxID=1237068 RepID=A0A8H4PJU1_9HYPO|nr:Isoflavone reductase like P3 [Fusarium albosuccineum]